MKRWDEAHAAVAAGDAEAALQAVLSLWRSCRAVELEGVIDRLSEWADSALAPLPETDWAAPWEGLARAARAVDLPRLLVHLASPPLGGMARRMDTIAAFAPDPRLGPVFLAYIDEPPTTSSSNFAVWTRLFKLLPGCVDTRAQEVLAAAAAAPGGSSGFWTKRMNWCGKTLEGLEPPAPLPDDWVEPLSSLREQLEARIAEGPPVVSEPGIEGPPTHEPVKSLDGALAALESGGLAEVLDGLVGFWGTYREGAVADLIEELDPLVEAPPIAGKRAKDREAAWTERAADPAPSEVGVLLEYAGSGRVNKREIRLEAMLYWRPDPRVYRFARNQIVDYQVGARSRFWAAVGDLLVHHLDPRAASHFAHLEERYGPPGALNRYQAIRRQIRRIASDYHASAGALLAMPAWERPKLDALVEGVQVLIAEAERRALGSADEESALVDAILAAPDSDEARLVYADWLTERGDPRGECIVLDVQLAQGKRVRGKREKAFKKHAEALLGPLSAVVGYGVSYERGLPVKATLTDRALGGLSEPDLDALRTDLRWAFFRELVAPGDLGLVFSHAPLRGIRSMRFVTLDTLEGMAARECTVPLETLSLSPGEVSPEAWSVLDRLPDRLPELRTLDVVLWSRPNPGRLTPPVELFQTQLAKKVEQLACGISGAGGTSSMPEWLSRMVAVGCTGPDVHLAGSQHIQHARSRGDGTWDLHLTLRNYTQPRRLEGKLAWLGALRGVPHVASFETVFDNVTPECEALLSEALGL